MKSLVTGRLRIGDKIPDGPGDRREHLVQHPQGLIAGLDIRNNSQDFDRIINGLEQNAIGTIKIGPELLNPDIHRAIEFDLQGLIA